MKFFSAKLKLTAVLFLFISLFPNNLVWAQDRVIPKDEIVAEVNGEKITREHLNRTIDSMKRMMQEARENQPQEIPEIPMEYMINQALETIISFELIYQKAAQLGITVSPEELDNEIKMIKETMGEDEFKKNTAGISEDFFKGSVLKSIYIKKVMQEVTPESATKVTEKDIKEQYDRMKGNLRRNYDMIRISHIFLKTPDKASDEEIQAVRDKAQEVKKLLDEGADWAKTAVKYSDAVTDNAETGYFVPVPSFMNKIVKGELPSEIGSISGILETQDGFVIVKLLEKRDKGGFLTIEEASNTIANMLESQKAAEFVDKYVKGLRSQANIKIYIKQHGK